MRGLFWLLALFALAVGLSLAARFNDGYVLVVLPPWRVEVSLNLTIVAIVGGFGLLYGALRGIALTLSLPDRVRAFRDKRAQERASRTFEESLRLLFEGRFGHALKKAAAAHAAGQAPGLSALIAARAAQRMRESGKQEAWLDRATLDDNRTQVARLMLEAEMQIDGRRFEEAVATLGRLQQIAGRHIAALRLELRAQQGAGRWDDVLRLARQLEKRDALPPEVAREVKLQAHQASVAQRSGDVSQLRAYLGRIPAGEAGPRLAFTIAEAFVAQEACDDARNVIETQLEQEWDPALVRLYGRAGHCDNLPRIACAERWLKTHPRDAGLLLTLGRLCVLEQLWGKAQSYFEASLSIEESRDAHLELARLADKLGRTDEANRHYRVSAGLEAD